jgi:hypothetical protein
MIKNNDRLIIVAGMAYSGTTILTYILKQHPDIFCGVNSPNSRLLENSWLWDHHTTPIIRLLSDYPNKQILLKRPWITSRSPGFLIENMPDAKYVYCHRDFEEIAKSWSKPTSLVIAECRNAKDQQTIYKKTMEKDEYFGRTIKNFYSVYHPKLLKEPRMVIDHLAKWLALDTYEFDLSKVDPQINIKEHI